VWRNSWKRASLPLLILNTWQYCASRVLPVALNVPVQRPSTTTVSPASQKSEGRTANASHSVRSLSNTFDMWFHHSEHRSDIPPPKCLVEIAHHLDVAHSVTPLVLWCVHQRPLCRF